MQKKSVDKTKSQVKRKKRTIQPMGITMNLDLKDLGKSLNKLSKEIEQKVEKTVKNVSRQVSRVLSTELKKYESKFGQIEKKLSGLSLPGKAKVQPKPRGRRPTTKTCSMKGCNEKHLAKGLCRRHYWEMKNEQRKAAKTKAARKVAAPKKKKPGPKKKGPSKVSKPESKRSLKEKKTCSVEGCNNFPIARGYCRKHYEHWRRGKIHPTL